MIAHRFQSRFVLAGMCDYCRKIMVTGMVCRYCKYSCHSKCARHVPPTCGLPTEYEDYFKVCHVAEACCLQNSHHLLIRPRHLSR